MSASEHLQAAGYSIASNISVQICARAFTFILRAISLKYLESSALLGIIHVRVALLYTTLQFLSREPFRRACLGGAAQKKNWSKIVNTIWLGVPLSVSLAIPLYYVWKWNSPSTDDLTGTNDIDYQKALFYTCLAVIVEMIAEPCYVYAQAKAIINHNPTVEIISVSLKCIISCYFVVQSSHHKPSNIITKTAISQLVASLISVLYSYWSLCKTENLSATKFLPSTKHVEGKSNKESRKTEDDKYFDEQSFKLTRSFMKQTFLKQLLTEGERYVMTFFNVISLSDQGVYDVINNLGSLAARLVFKPIEESGYTLFSQTVKRDEILDIRRFYWVQVQLMSLIKAMLLLGLTVLTLGYNFVPLIVIYGGEKLNNPIAFHLMKWQLFYTPLIAVNGVTECFTFAVMSTSEMGRYNIHLIGYSLVFLAVVFTSQAHLGSACFMLANCSVMVLRIYFSYQLIKVYFRKHGYEPRLQDGLPSLTTLISMSGVFIFLSVSQHYLLDMTKLLSFATICSLILGAWCLFFIIHVVLCHEETLLNFLSRLFKLKFHQA